MIIKIDEALLLVTELLKFVTFQLKCKQITTWPYFMGYQTK